MKRASPVRLPGRRPWLPFAGAWVIWLGGYALLLGADFVVRRLPGVGHGLDALPVMVTATLVAGTACGFFLASARRWAMPYRVLLLMLQAPFAYLAAVTLGYVYLCSGGGPCP